MGFFNNLGKTISDAGQGAIQKGKDMAEIARYNSQINDEERKIAGVYEKIGRQYVNEYGANPGESFQDFVDELKASEEAIEELKRKLKEVKGVAQCPSCGAEVPNGAMFCSVCGAKVIVEQETPQETSQKEIFCTGCGAAITEDSKFCTSCGKPVETEADVEKVVEDAVEEDAESAKDKEAAETTEE